MRTHSKFRFPVFPKIVNEDFELMHIYIKSKQHNYSLILFYRATSSNNITSFLAEVEKIMQNPQLQSNNFILIGDANIDLTIADNNQFSKNYIEGLQTLNMKQIITIPSTLYKSISDHIWISNTNEKYFADVRTTYYSDHMPLILDLE